VSADFADALFRAGNINEVERDRERAAAEEIALDAVRAEVDVAATRAALGALLGADAGQTFEVATALPLPVPAEDDEQALTSLAAAARLDLLAAQRRVTVLEDALGLARSYRWLGAFEAGVEYERDPDGSELGGPRFEFELPIFNQGQGRIARAEAQLDAARAEARALSLAIGAELVRARAEVAAARIVVDRHRERILPLRERIAEGSRRLQNYMLIGQFEALADRRAVYAAYVGYLQALGDYWQARARLARAIGAPLPSIDGAGSAVEPAALLAPATPASPGPRAHHAH
jgi:outer membrane protein TolC